MKLTDDEIAEIKFRMGYSAMTLAARPYMDIAVIFEVTVQENVNDFGVNRIRTSILPKLRKIEEERFAARTRYKVDAVIGEVKLSDKEDQKYANLYNVWLRDLASLIRVPIAPDPPDYSGGHTMQVS